MAQSPQLKQSSPTSPDPQDFRLDATPAMRADNVVSGEHWRIGLITDSLVRFEWSDSGVFENRPTQTVLNRDFGSPVERRVTERDGRVIIDTAALTIVYDQQPFSKEGLSVVVKGVADTQFNTWHYGDAQRGNLKRPSEAAGAELMAFVAYYELHIAQNQRNKVIDAQVRTFRHNREHYQKITANLLPILSMLTSGDLGRSLSPDPFDVNDSRPIMNFEKIERAGHVLYMCLDSLPDPSVASAIGALALADQAARAGMRYNLGGYRRIALFVDEVSNVINQPLIEILNKGAEGGIFTTCAMQTLADLAKRLGSEDAARMAVGNLNNLIALRTKDRPTQDFVTETFGKTAIHTVRVGLSHGADAHLGDFSSSYSTQLTESFEEVVPAEVLGKLPNLQYFASVSGGRIIKGRFPIIDPDLDADVHTEEVAA